VLVGAVLAIALVALTVGTVYLARGGLQTGYPLYLRLPWGSGIKQGQPVLLTGVNVGFVGDVDLRQDGTLIVTLRVEKQYHVPEGTTATVEPNGIFGDADVALRPARPSVSYIAAGDTVPAGKAAPGIAELMARADSASGRLDDVARAVQVELVQGNGIADLRKMLENANGLVVQLSGIAAEQSKQLSQAMHTLNRSVSAIDSVTIDSTIKNLKTTTANMSALSDNLEQATGRLNTIMTKVDSGTGTAGKLINDPTLYNKLRRWHHLSFLKSSETVMLLEKIRHGARAPEMIERLCHVVEDDLGLPLHASVEAAKVALSSSDRARLAFARPGVELAAPIARADFDAWIAEELAAIDGAVTDALAAAGVHADAIDRVFTTGGSSQVAAVRATLAARFGADKLVGGEELTSVAAGLAAVAAH